MAQKPQKQHWMQKGNRCMAEILNPYYTSDPDAPPVPQIANSFRSVHYSELTPRFLLEECLNRGWKDIYGRVQSYEETDGGWSITCRLGPRNEGTYEQYFVSRDRGDDCRAEGQDETLDG